MCMHLIRVLIPRVSVIRIHWTVEYWLWFWIQYIFLAVNEYEIGWMGMRFSSIIIYIAVTLFLVNNAIANSSTHRELKDECGVTYTDRIIGGKNASLGQYPWLARIGYKCKQQHIRWFFPIKPYSHYIVHKYLIAKGKRGYIHGCGGALIDRLHIITAAHCVKNLGRRIKLCVCVCVKCWTVVRWQENITYLSFNIQARNCFGWKRRIIRYRLRWWYLRRSFAVFQTNPNHRTETVQ